MRFRDNNIVGLKIRVADMKMGRSWLAWDERGGNSKKALKVLDMVRWRLLLILVRFSPYSLERVKGYSIRFKESHLLFGASIKCRLSGGICVLVSSNGGKSRGMATYMVLGVSQAAISCHTIERGSYQGPHRIAHPAGGRRRQLH